MNYSEFDNMQALRWAKKIITQNRLGGECILCGCKDSRVLDFHHSDRNKEKNVSKLLSHTLDKIWIEAKKCSLLCRNCHHEFHSKCDNPLRRQYKDNMLKYLNAKCCSNCGYSHSIVSLDFHHVDPKLKKFKLSSMSYGIRSSDKIKRLVEEELDKCNVLCRNCHMIEHLNLNGNLERLDGLIREKQLSHIPNSSPLSKSRRKDMKKKNSLYRNELASIIKTWRNSGKNISATAKILNMDSNTVSDNLHMSKVYIKYRKRRSKKTSKYIGVSWIKSRNKWLASVKVNRKTKNLGRYDSEDLANSEIIKYKNGLI